MSLRNESTQDPRAHLPQVIADVTVDCEPVNVAGILDLWSDQEIDELLSGNSEALETLAADAFDIAMSDFYIGVNRAEVEAFKAARKAKTDV